MYDVNAFECQVADEALRMAGPSEPVDDAAVHQAMLVLCQYGAGRGEQGRHYYAENPIHDGLRVSARF